MAIAAPCIKYMLSLQPPCKFEPITTENIIRTSKMSYRIIFVMFVIKQPAFQKPVSTALNLYAVMSLNRIGLSLMYWIMLKLELEGHSVERMYLRQRCSDAAGNKTILKQCLAAAVGRQYVYVGFSRLKIPRTSACTIAEKAIRLRHPPSWKST